MAGKIDGSHGLRPLPAHTPEPEKPAAADKKKDKKSEVDGDVAANPKGWKAEKAQQGKTLKQPAARAGDVKPLKELVSKLATLKQAAEVPERFATDLDAARPELVNHPALLREDKAQRLFNFAVPYAQAAVAKSATPDEKQAVARELLVRAQQGGYGLLQPRDANDTLGKDGLAALRELMQAQTADQVAEHAATFSFDIPSWPSDAQVLAEARAAAAEQQQALPQAGVAPETNAPAPFVSREEEEEAAQRDRTTNKRLGGNMLWNVMHLFRDDGDDDRESAEQREAKAQAFLIAGLVFVLLAIIVVAFVSM